MTSGTTWQVSAREEDKSSEHFAVYDTVTDAHGRVDAVRQQAGRDVFRVAVIGHQACSLVAADVREAVKAFTQGFETDQFKPGDTVEIVVTNPKNGGQIGKYHGWVDELDNLKAEVQEPDEDRSASQPVRRGRGR